MPDAVSVECPQNRCFFVLSSLYFNFFSRHSSPRGAHRGVTPQGSYRPPFKCVGKFWLWEKVGGFAMPQFGAKREVSCADCWFRRELLCALQTDEPCPTFRQVVGRSKRPERPDQAVLIPLAMPQVADSPAVSPTPVPRPSRIVDPVPMRPAATRPTVDPRPVEGPSKVAAARRNTVSTCVVEIPDLDSGGAAPSGTATSVSGSSTSAERSSFSSTAGSGIALSGRIASRISARYPRAVQRF